jgi:class 3 adenylate cyclase
MAIFKPANDDYAQCSHGKTTRFLKKDKFDEYGPQVLGLGDLGSPTAEHEVVCAMFDLEGFTDFCRQVDPHLAIPEFLRQFVEWLFGCIKKNWVLPEERLSAVDDPIEGAAITWAELPRLAKFTGDGVMFLWDACSMDPRSVSSVACLTLTITTEYEVTFLPRISKDVSYAPRKLRCGVTRGKAFAVGNGDHYVGPCINIAARLQKTAPGVTVTISRRGFRPEHWSPETASALTLKRFNIRGIGQDELVYIRRNEFDRLDSDARLLFREP